MTRTTAEGEKQRARQYSPVRRRKALGYHVVSIPSDTQRAAVKAMRRVLVAVARDRSASSMTDHVVSFKEREAIVETAAYLDRGRCYAG